MAIDAPPDAVRLGVRRALALGLLHGPLELLPVSSSAHAALLGARGKEAEVALHAGAALALGPLPRLGFAALTVAPPALAGLLLERVVERRLGTPRAIAAGLLAGSAALVAADGVPGTRTAAAARAGDAVALGVAQACALWPGVSRTGATLAAARARGFCDGAAWELSRAAAAPVLAAAAALKGFRLAQRRPPARELAALAAGATASAASTAAARRFGATFERVPWTAWAAYRATLAGAVLLLGERRGRRRTRARAPSPLRRRPRMTG